MRRLPWLMVVLLLLPAGRARAQQQRSIVWLRDVKEAVARAKATRHPMMFWVLGRSASRNHRIERRQKRAFADPVVYELAQRFVTVRISRSRYPEQLEQWGLSRRTNLELVFTTPEGELLDRLAPLGAADPEVLARKMALVFQAYRDRLFETQLRPVLEDEEAGADKLRQALRDIREFVILSATPSVISLLEREQLPETVRRDVYETLAVLSTREAVEALIDHVAGDPAAAQALGKCTIGAAEYMLPALGDDDLELHLAVYHALVRICRIEKPVSDRFWNGKIKMLKDREIERVRRRVLAVSPKWREKYEMYR